MKQYYWDARAAAIMALCLLGVVTGVSKIMTDVQGCIKGCAR